MADTKLVKSPTDSKDSDRGERCTKNPVDARWKSKEIKLKDKEASKGRNYRRGGRILQMAGEKCG